MARKPRIHFPGAFYHVIARGNRRQKIFLEDEDYTLYLAFLREYKQRDRFFLYAYALMPNHVHLLIEVDQVPLSRLMQCLQFRYCRNFNIKYKKWGHLFQGRYKAILCEKDSYFLELSAYIHLNAVRAGLVDDPGKYPWSSYSFYLTDSNHDGLIDTEFLLRQFSNNPSPARKAYADFVIRRIGQGYREDLYEVKDQCLLGSEEFVDHIRHSHDDQPRRRYDISLNEIVTAVGSTLDIPTELFFSLSRNRRGARGRSAAGYLARKLCGARTKTVAAHFNRDPAVLSQGINNLEQRLLIDKPLAENLNTLEAMLTFDKRKIYT
jgi:putative transposase